MERIPSGLCRVFVHVVLEVGQVTEQVEVQANASLVETRSVGVGRIMETERIMELPLNGRNARELMLLAGGTVSVPLSGSSSIPVPRNPEHGVSI